MATPTPEKQLGRQPRVGLLIGVGGILALGVVVALIVYGGRSQGDQRAVATYARQQTKAQFGTWLQERLGHDITRVAKAYGFCGIGCDQVLFAGEAAASWELKAKDVALQILLTPVENMLPPHQLGYRLQLHYASNREDGDVAPVNPKLQQLIDTILRHYNFPAESNFPTPRSLIERGNSTYVALYSQYRPSLGHSFHHTGHESLRGERTVTILRYGPFEEDGSWLRERS